MTYALLAMMHGSVVQCSYQIQRVPYVYCND